MLVEKFYYRLEDFGWKLLIEKSEAMKNGDKMKFEILKVTEQIINILKSGALELTYIKFQVMEFLARKNPELLYWLLRKNEFHPAVNMDPIVVERFRKKYGVDDGLKRYLELLAKIRDIIHWQEALESFYRKLAEPIVVGEKDVGKTAKEILKERFDNQYTIVIDMAFERGEIKVNGKKVNLEYRVKENDVIGISTFPRSFKFFKH